MTKDEVKKYLIERLEYRPCKDGCPFTWHLFHDRKDILHSENNYNAIHFFVDCFKHYHDGTVRGVYFYDQLYVNEKGEMVQIVLI